MIVMGNKVNPCARNGSSRNLAAHLSRTDTNERVAVQEMRGFASEDLDGAFEEINATAAGTRARSAAYHAKINPERDEHLTAEQGLAAADRLERELGFDGRARVVVEHVKNGRQHFHVVWSRIDIEQMRAIDTPDNYAAHELVARELERDFGLKAVKNRVHSRDWDEPRPDRRPENWTYQQAERTLGRSPEEVRADVKSIYAGAKNGRELQAALEAKGYRLARGDKDGVLLVVHGPHSGDHVSLTRAAGRAVRKADVEAKTADITIAKLPTLDEARSQVADQRTREGRSAEPDKGEHWKIERRRLWDEYQGERKQRRALQWDEQHDKEKARQAQIRKTFLAKRDKIKAAPVNYAERRAALSIIRMESVAAELEAAGLTRGERHQLKHEQAEQDHSRYTEFLAEKARGGDEQALSELRWRAKREEREKDTSALTVTTTAREPKDRPPYAPIYRELRLDYHVERNGDVIYKRDGKAVLADRRDMVQVLQGDSKTIETGLRLAQKRYGYNTALHLTGSDAFKEKAARTTAEAGLNIEFDDARFNKIVAERQAEIAAERQKGRSQVEPPASQVKWDERKLATARQDFEQVAAKVASKAHGWEKHYKAAPHEMRTAIDAHNRIPVTDQKQRAEFVRAIAPQKLAAWLQQYRQARRSIDRGMER